MTDVDRKELAARLRTVSKDLTLLAAGQPGDHPDLQVLAAGIVSLHHRLESIRKELEQVADLKRHLDRIVAGDHEEFRRGEHYRNKK